MKATETSIGDLFLRDVRFVAPLYQRPYVWTREKNWVPMWDAIRLVANRQAPGGSGQPRPYFLGAIVLEPLPLPTTHVRSWQLIDGQQRLTTLQVALAAWSALCRDRGYDDLSHSYRNLTRNELLETQDPSEGFKVWPTNRDRSTYAAVILGEARDGHGAHNQLLIDAAEFFRAQLSDWLDEDRSEERGRLGNLLAALKRWLVIVEISLERDDDPQQIFETLNSLGTPLLNADLVKNLLFRGLSDTEATRLYETTWRHFEDGALFWRDRVRQGRLLTPRIDLFLQHYLVAHLRREVPATELFAEFRTYFLAGGNSAAEELRELLEYARIFERIEKMPRAEPTSPLGAALRRLHRLDTTTVYPLLLELFRRMSDEKATQAVKVLESYLVRRAVCRLTTKNYNRLFVQILRDLQADWTPEHLERVLAGLEDDTSRWPSDDELVASWMTVDAYKTLRTNRLLAIFEGLEREARSPKSEEIRVEGELSIEHILPQGWTESAWPIPTDIEAVEAVGRRKRLIHNIGNLAVLTSKLNSTQSNNAWSVKRPILLKHSVSVLNNSLPSEWSDQSIQLRAAQLSELAKMAWPGPPGAIQHDWKERVPTTTDSADDEEPDERGSTYQRFFRRVFAEFKAVRPNASTSDGSGGWGWFSFPTEGTEGTYSRYSWSFAIGKRLRCELYLDAKSKTIVKTIFDGIWAHRTEVEAAYGAELSWERLESKKASRIADYRDGNVFDEPALTDDLAEWAVTAMVSLYDAVERHLIYVK